MSNPLSISISLDCFFHRFRLVVQQVDAAVQRAKWVNKLITKKIVGYTIMNLSFIAVDFSQVLLTHISLTLFLSLSVGSLRIFSSISFHWTFSTCIYIYIHIYIHIDSDLHMYTDRTGMQFFFFLFARVSVVGFRKTIERMFVQLVKSLKIELSISKRIQLLKSISPGESTRIEKNAYFAKKKQKEVIRLTYQEWLHTRVLIKPRKEEMQATITLIYTCSFRLSWQLVVSLASLFQFLRLPGLVSAMESIKYT